MEQFILFSHHLVEDKYYWDSAETDTVEEAIQIAYTREGGDPRGPYTSGRLKIVAWESTSDPTYKDWTGFPGEIKGRVEYLHSIGKGVTPLTKAGQTVKKPSLCPEVWHVPTRTSKVDYSKITAELCKGIH